MKPEDRVARALALARRALDDAFAGNPDTGKKGATGCIIFRYRGHGECARVEVRLDWDPEHIDRGIADLDAVLVASASTEG